MIDRLMAKIEIDPKTKCWNWLGGDSGTGYGRITIDGKTQPSHRVFYKVFRGPIENGLQIDHLCRNKRCQNPYHLELVTCRENLHRRPIVRGEHNGGAKLTEEQVLEIR